MSKGINGEYFMGFIGIGVALLIGTLLFGQSIELMDQTIEDNNCSGINATMNPWCAEMNKMADTTSTMFTILPIIVIIMAVLLVVIRLPESIDHDDDPSTPNITVKIPLYKIIILRVLLIIGLAKRKE